MAGIRNVEESSPRNWLVELEGDRPKMVIKFNDDPKGKLNGSITSVAFQMSSGKVVNYEIRSAYGALINLRLYGLFFGEGRGGDNILRILPSAYTVLCLTKDMAEKFENMIAPVMVYVRVVVQTPSMALSSETGFGMYGDSYCDMIKRYESQGARYALDKSEVFDASKTCPKTTIYLR